MSSLGVSISSDRDTAAKPRGHAQARSWRVPVATDEHEPGLDANAKYPDTVVRLHPVPPDTDVLKVKSKAGHAALVTSREVCNP